jgi:hypothetical protein
MSITKVAEVARLVISDTLFLDETIRTLLSSGYWVRTEDMGNGKVMLIIRKDDE